MPNTVRIGTQVTGAKGAASELDQLRDKFTKLQAQGAKGLAIGVGAAVATKAFNLVGSAISEVTGFLGDSAHAFIEDQHSIQQLNTSLKANVAGWNGNTDAIEAYVKANLALGFSDDEQRKSLAGLVAATHDVGKALKIESVAMDLARFKGISLGDASEALTKVEAGSYRVLKSLGIQLKDGATQTEALAAVEKVASGQAADFAQTIEGKLTVAEAKTLEAQEKLGKGLAELESVILPAAADAVSALADGLDTLSYNFDHVGETIPKDQLAGTVGPFFQLGHAAEDASGAMADLSDFAGKVADDFSDTGRATTNLSRDIQMGSGHLQAMGASFRIAEMEAGDLDSAIAGLSSTIDEELFGKAITAGHLAELKQTHKDLVKQREEVEKGTPKWKILTGQIAENEQAQFDLQLQMKQKEGPHAVIDWLKKQKQLFGDATGAIQKLIDKELRLITVNENLSASAPYSDGGPKSVAHKHRAGGGPVSKGVAYTVGEQGPETFVAPSNGTIVPNGGVGGGTMGVGGLTIIFNSVWPPTPADAERVARQLVPHITREQQRQGLVPRTR